MGGGAAERTWWRVWVLCTWMAVAAVLVQGWVRVELLGGGSSPPTCDVVADAGELLPADCWLPTGWFGLRSWTPSWGDPGWQLMALIAAASLVGVLAARSAARRQALVMRVATGWLVGGFAACWAFEQNVWSSTGAGPGWPLRMMGWGPLAFSCGMVFGFWAYSPWRTLYGPGLRSRRRLQAARRARRAELLVAARAAVRSVPSLVGAWAVARPGWTAMPSLPDVHAVPSPVRLSWPVEPAGVPQSGFGGVIGG